MTSLNCQTRAARNRFAGQLRTEKRSWLSTAAGRIGNLTRAIAAGAVLAVAVAGCAEQVIKHGQHFRANDLQQIQPGMTRDQVKLTLGTPSTTTTTGSGNAYYYISSTSTQQAFFKPTEKERQVAAVYFNQTGSVDRVANYGLKDGKVFDYITATTPAPGASDEGILKQLFRNLGAGAPNIFGEGS